MVRIADILKGMKPLSKGEREKTSPPSSGQKTPRISEGGPISQTPSPKEPIPPTKGFSFSGLGRAQGAVPSPPPSRTERERIPIDRTLPPDVAQHEGMGRFVAKAFKESGANRVETASTVYQEALKLAEKLLEEVKTGEPIEGKNFHQVIDDIIRELTYENSDLLGMACNPTATEEEPNFLPSKLVNKTILAVEIGIGKKMNKSKLFQLGLSAFLSDLGIVEVHDIVTKKDVLTAEEAALLKNVPSKTAEIIKKIKDIDQVAVRVAEEFHERSDGSGPAGIKDMSKLDEFSRIIAVIDVFESLTHDRPHRSRKMPHEAMKLILEEGSKFEADVLRLLVDRVGIYPIGSWVMLSNKEIAKVVRSNPGQPLRPKIKVMFDEHGRPLEEPPLIDLIKNLTLHVLQPVSDEDLKKLIDKNKES